MTARRLDAPGAPAITHYNQTADGGAACDGYRRDVENEAGTPLRARVTCPDCRELIEAPTPDEIGEAVDADVCVSCGRLHWQSTLPRATADYLADGACGDCAAGSRAPETAVVVRFGQTFYVVAFAERFDGDAITHETAEANAVARFDFVGPATQSNPSCTVAFRLANRRAKEFMQ